MNKLSVEPRHHVRPRRTRRVLAVAAAASLLVGAATTFPGVPLASADAGADTPDLSTTSIGADGRSIVLLDWFSAVDAGTVSETNRDFTWTAPSTVSSIDAVVFGGGGGGGGGKAGNQGNATTPNVRGAGGGGGGGGEVRRDTAIGVNPGETLNGRAGAGGAGGVGAPRTNTDPGGSGGFGSASSLERSDSTPILLATGGLGGGGGVNNGGSTTSSGGEAGEGGTGGSGGTELTPGIAGTGGSNSSTAPAAPAGLNNSGAEWTVGALRLGLGGGGGGGKSSNGGSTDVISPGTTSALAVVHDFANLTNTITRIGGDGDGGNDKYVSDLTKNAPIHLGGGGGGGSFVFSSGRAAGRGGAGGVLLSYTVADLVTSTLTPAATSILRGTGSTTVTLQLRNAAGVAADVSVGPVTMTVDGTDATLGSVTDNGDGTYTATLSAGQILGTATVTATVAGSNVAETAEVTVGDTPPSTTTTTPAPTTTTAPAPGPPRPIPDSSGQLPKLAPGTGSASENGVEVPVVVVFDNGTMILRGPGFELRLAGDCGASCTVLTTPDGRQTIALREGGSATVSGFGFKPGTPLYGWLFSEPRFLGELAVEDDGSFSARINLSDVPPGEHTLQVNGTSDNDAVRSVNLGVLVEAATTSAGGLPVTGAAVMPLVAAGMMLVGSGVGAATLAARHRRRGDDSPTS